MHVNGVGSSNAKEISEEAEEDDGLEKHGEEEVLLALLSVDVRWNISHTGVEFILLVDEDKVNQIPNSDEEY